MERVAVGATGGSESKQLGRLLVVSHDFPPSSAIGGRRILRLLQELSLQCTDWRLLTTTTQITAGYQETLDLARVIPITDWSEAIADAWKKQRLSCSRVGYRRSRPFSSTNRIRDNESATSRKTFRLDRTWVWAQRVFRQARQIDDGWTPDIVLVSVPPLSVLFAGHRIARHFDAKLAIDYRDLLTLDGYYKSPVWPPKLQRRREKQVLRAAQVVTAATHGIAKRLENELDRGVPIIKNGFEPEEIADLGALSLGPHVNLVYTGALYGTRRDPSLIFKCLRNHPLGKQVMVHYFGQEGQVFIRRACEYQVQDQVIDHGYVERRTALRAQLASDLLILLVGSGPEELTVATAKIYDYIGSGRPILMVGNPQSPAAHIVRSQPNAMLAQSTADVDEALKRTFYGEWPHAQVPHESMTRQYQARKWINILQMEN